MVPLYHLPCQNQDAVAFQIGLTGEGAVGQSKCDAALEGSRWGNRVFRYLLELQCVQNDKPQPGDDDNSFVTKHLSVATTTYVFDANKMPKGKWQWRVHALNKTGFLSHMDEWRVFYSQ